MSYTNCDCNWPKVYSNSEFCNFIYMQSFFNFFGVFIMIFPFSERMITKLLLFDPNVGFGGQSKYFGWLFGTTGIYLCMVWHSQNYSFILCVSVEVKKWGGAGLISISHFTTIFAYFRGYSIIKMKQISFQHLKIDENAKWNQGVGILPAWWNGCKFRVITMRGWGLSISYHCKMRWGRWTKELESNSLGGHRHRFKLQVVLA